MNPDLCVPCGDGIVNIRVGAIIMKDGKILMVKNRASDYFYSVGGRIKMGEIAEEAVVREVFEETGVRLNVRRLAFLHENVFYGDSPAKRGQLVYEISFYFLMDVPEDFEPLCGSVTENGVEEELVWLSPDAPERLYPGFFRTELDHLSNEVKFFKDDERR